MMVDFTGTAEEKAFKSKIHQMLLLNELGGVEARAYQLGIGDGKSGYSFGFAQWDLVSNNQTAWGILHDILQNAIVWNDFSFEHEYVIDDGDPNTDRSHDTTIEALKNKAKYRVGDPRSFSSDDVVHINTALSSEYGKNKIDTMHDAHLGGDLIPWVKNVIASVTDAQDRAFLQSDLGSLFLADVKNQFKLKPVNNGLAQFVCEKQ